jgi:hypothetical protein
MMSPLGHIEETFHSIFWKTGKITSQTSSSWTYQSQCQTISWQTVSSNTFVPSPIKERNWKTMWDWSTLQNKQLQMGHTRLCHTLKEQKDSIHH